jgi:hypothetical protein
VDPTAPVLKCPYCHHDVKQTIAMPPPEPEPERPPVVVVEKKVVVVHPSPEAVRRAGRGLGCGITLATLLIIAVSAGIPLWQSGVLRSVVGGVKSAVKGDPEPAEAQKLDALADLLDAGNSLRSSYQRYRSWQESPDGPSCQERHVGWGLHEVHLGAVDRGQKALGEEPRLAELESVAGSFANALRAAAATFNEARRYYDQKDYKDDGCAKGRSYHAAIESGYQRAEGEARKLRDLLAKQIGVFLERRLERWKREQPGGGNATLIQALIHARELALEIDRQQAAPEAGGEGTSPDRERVWAKIRALEGSLQAALAAAPPTSSDRRASVTWPYTAQDHFRPRLETLLKESKAYARTPGPEAAGAALGAWNDTLSWAGWAGPALLRSERPVHRRPGRGVAFEPGAPIAARGLPVELVRRVVAAHSRSLRRCLPAATTRIVVRFSVGKTGRVTTAEVSEPATLPAPARRCVDASVRRWVFPAPGAEFTITFPIAY